MAKTLAGEVRSHVYVAADLGYLAKQRSDERIVHVQGFSRSIGAFVNHLKSTI